MDKKMASIATSMLILKLLEEEPMYGYQIIKELEYKSEEVFVLKEGTLYPLLHTLEQQGHIASTEKTAPTGRKRKYYQLTASGRRVLEEKIAEWETYHMAVNKVLEGRLNFES